MNYFDMISTWSFQKITIVYESVVLTMNLSYVVNLIEKNLQCVLNLELIST